MAVSVGFDLTALRAAVARRGRAVRVVVAEARGSSPRAPGAAMLVWADGFSGSVGGGALEWEALAEARRLLARGGGAAVRRFPLGPGLGQCCGGAVTLAFEAYDAEALEETDARIQEGGANALARPLTRSGLRPPGGAGRHADAPLAIRAGLRAARAGRAPGVIFAPGDPAWLLEPLAAEAAPLFLYGAGHVGRAIVRMLEGLPVATTWVDDARDRFPQDIPDHARMLVAADPADAVALAPPEAAHLVMTYSHPLDLEICHRALTRGCARLGVIGSASKAARFRSRLRALGP